MREASSYAEMSSKTSGAELRARAVPKVGRKGELRVAKASGGGRTKERRTGMGRKQATERYVNAC